MNIKIHNIPIKQLYEGYIDQGEDGVFGFDEQLSIRPPFQREFVYKMPQQIEVIKSILKGYPLNVMYWMIAEKDENGEPCKFELIDGQQRTISICRYIDGEFTVDINGKPQYFHNLTADIQKMIMDYELMVYYCEGTDQERLEWFKIINTACETLTEQELRNAVYTGPWVTNAKKVFSKTGCYAYNLGKDYLKGDPIRQDYLETVLKWVANKDGIASIDEYMAQHQDDANANDLKKYFTDVLEWVEKLFPNYNAKMKGLDWGLLYNKYHAKKYDPAELKKDVDALMGDYEVQKKPAIYEYILGGKKDHKLLNLRQFDEPTKMAQYAAQNGICPMCGGHFEYEEMHGDHKIAWTHGGKTDPDNCQMLCDACNLQKSATDASFI